MAHARSCRCPWPLPGRDIRVDGNGQQIAGACTACLRFVSQRCRVCLRDYRDLQLHLAKSECGPFDKAGMWWTADRPPNAGKDPRAAERQLEFAL